MNREFNFSDLQAVGKRIPLNTTHNITVPRDERNTFTKQRKNTTDYNELNVSIELKSQVCLLRTG